MEHEALNAEELGTLKRRCWRKFYLRPEYIWDRTRSVHSLRDLLAYARVGYKLLVKK